MRYIDITRTISSGMKKYPTDPAIEIRPFKSLRKGNSCNLLKLAFGTHTASHIDAPRHISDKGRGVDAIGFDKLICDVIVGVKEYFFKIAHDRKKMNGIKGVILKGAGKAAYLTATEASLLLRHNIRFIGTGNLSIEDASDRKHPVHRILLEKGAVIAENLKLAGVKTGRYKLICLPLKIKDGDGAPVRAVLIDD